MQKLPIHFFTIVLNGEPFIRYHIDVFRKLSVPWHWHIVEGVAELKHDTAWSVQNGGQIPGELHKQGLSSDSTTAYIDRLKEECPENITVYRKPLGIFWDGKREMVNAPLVNIQEDAILFQVDCDELWTTAQIHKLHSLFTSQPEKTSAWFWCHFFVGPELVVSSRNCYSSNSAYEWQRAWRFAPGNRWAAHEPPCLINELGEDIGRKNPFTHFETEENGLVFQHFAYTTENQLRFKEQYYGYQSALEKWKALQNERRFPVLLRDYFSWVKDSTGAEHVDRLGLVPLAKKSEGGWEFEGEKESPSEKFPSHSSPAKIVELSSSQDEFVYVIDGVYFSVADRGITRVWRTLLEEWSLSGFGKNIVLLDRGYTAPDLPGIRKRIIPPYDKNDPHADRIMLEKVCREEGATLFSSTYYTTPQSTPSVLLVYDMIPEVLGWDTERNPDWRDKHHAIRQAVGFLCISENTKRDLLKYFPVTAGFPCNVVDLGYDRNVFSPASKEEIIAFHNERGIEKPYYLLVGSRLDYKNAQLLFDSLALLLTQHGFAVFCTGNDSCVEQVVNYGREKCGCDIHFGKLSERELAVAYSGAVALAFPSVYEGFGLPLIEAMACLCPVVSYSAATSKEILRDAGLIAESTDEFSSALCEVQKPLVRRTLIRKGLSRAKDFCWSRCAKQFQDFLLFTADQLRNQQSAAGRCEKSELRQSLAPHLS